MNPSLFRRPLAAGACLVGLVAAIFVDAPMVALAAAGKSCGGVPATLVGSAGPERLTGTSGPDVIVGLGGNDTIRGLAGNDVVCAGGGRDRVFGGVGDDELWGGPGNDDLSAKAGADVLRGNGGNDELFGSGGADWLRGGGDPDQLSGGLGPDVMDGGEGPSDTVDYGYVAESSRTTGVTVDLDATGANDGSVEDERRDRRDTVQRVENLVGTEFDDVLWGNGEANYVFPGFNGLDEVFGRGGNDLIDVTDRPDQINPDTADCGKGRHDQIRANEDDSFSNCEDS